MCEPPTTCGAKTRSGSPCRKSPMSGKRRCRLHGGKSSGPRTAAGIQRIRDANLKHGLRTNEVIAEAKRRAAEGRAIRQEIKESEAWCVEIGLLKKTWRRDWTV